MGFLYNNQNIIPMMVFLLLIVLNIVFVLAKNNRNDYLLFAKISLLSNYCSTVLSLPIILGQLFLLPMFMSLLFERFPNLLPSCSDNEKFIFITVIIFSVLAVWHLIIICISLLYFFKYLNILHEHNKNKMALKAFLYFVPILNIVLLFKKGKNEIREDCA
jgi:hypothetical protein